MPPSNKSHSGTCVQIEHSHASCPAKSSILSTSYPRGWTSTAATMRVEAVQSRISNRRCRQGRFCMCNNLTRAQLSLQQQPRPIRHSTPSLYECAGGCPLPICLSLCATHAKMTSQTCYLPITSTHPEPHLHWRKAACAIHQRSVDGMFSADCLDASRAPNVLEQQ